MSLWAALGVLLGIAGFAAKSRWNYLRLPQLHGATEPHGAVCVIIPARDEERQIAKVVGSFPGTRVVVVDDGSRDRTAAVAKETGASVIAAPPLPPGALGKPHACWFGASFAAEPWLLFVDADTSYRPEFLDTLVSYAERENLDAVSVFLRQERAGLAERILLPYAFALYFCGVNGRGVNDGRSGEALANGQCFLFRSGAYSTFGGHSAVLSSVIEDVALAHVLKAQGLRLRVLRAEDLGSVRMYQSFGGIWRGFQKNSFRFLISNWLTGVQVICASVLFTSYLPVLVWLLRDREFATAGLFALTPSLALVSWYGGLAEALLAPVAIYAFQLIALDGMLTAILGRKAVWKGRRV